jgi:hypothetical protein
MSTSPHRGAARLLPAALMIVAVLLAVAADAARAASTRTSFRAAAAKASSRNGDASTRTLLRFEVRGLPARVTRATLVVRGTRAPRSPVRVRQPRGRSGAGAVIGTWRPRRGGERAVRELAVDVTRAVRGNGRVELLVISSDRRAVRALRTRARKAARLVVQLAGGATSSSPAAGSPGAKSQTKAPAKAAPTPASPAGTAPTRPPGGPGLWISPGELAARPTSGAAWDRLKRTADGAAGPAAVADQDSDHDIVTLAAALVFARTGAPAYRQKAADGIGAAIGTEAGGRTLAAGRNLPPYVIAADLVGLAAHDGALDARFRDWLRGVRTANLDGDTLVATHESRPNNWGAMAGAARIAADAYLGDGVDLQRAATVLRGWLGDRGAYAGFSYGELSYQADPAAPVGVNPAGATKQGVSIDGALPDDMRRGCSFQPQPCPTDYAWEAMQGLVVQAELLFRAGFDSWSWSDQAVLRAARYLHGLDAQYGGWWARGDDSWQPWLINRAYGTSFAASSPSSPGKVMGFTDWTHGG